ncbi:MAG: hypothetical protein ACUVXA_17285 [Candidatus Jordarchaeum sp.]|uniref:hypothetical protein n=1 Tax=Candidatus Jordarchaeum sp. TaxID=2823881 RepID=UPI00404A9B40
MPTRRSDSRFIRLRFYHKASSCEGGYKHPFFGPNRIILHHQLAESAIKIKRISFLLGAREGASKEFIACKHGCGPVSHDILAMDLAAASALTALAFALH